MTRGMLSGGVATDVYTDEHGYLCCKYHKTIVVRWNASTITLDTGYWKTVTTKKRMNQVSTEFGLGFGVWARRGEWRVSFKGKDLEYRDGMVLVRGEEGCS